MGRNGIYTVMSNVEHAFENLLMGCLKGYPNYVERWERGDINVAQLSPEVVDAIEECAEYVIYTMFDSKEELERQMI